tara:strand:+ start:671 stop:1045 length:375 start_codon:yes stop_codon:yes gene_type:complete
MSKLGDCYEVHGKFLSKQGPNSDFVLVHAECIGQGQIEGLPFGHAFLLNKATDEVHDLSNGRNIVLPRAVYFAVGKIEWPYYISDGNMIERSIKVYEYSWEQMMENTLRTRLWGPWDLETVHGK